MEDAKLFVVKSNSIPGGAKAIEVFIIDEIPQGPGVRLSLAHFEVTQASGVICVDVGQQQLDTGVGGPGLICMD